jgi:UDP-N-acetylmuramate--alanine ligase
VSNSAFATELARESLRIHKVPKAHLVGIAGAGMSSLAEVLDAAGWEISGSDLNGQFAAGSRFQVHATHDAEHVDEELDLLVYSDAVPENNPEVLRARALGMSVLNYPQMLGRLMDSQRGVAIAGTHGKSTTTAMAGEILYAAGLDPTVVCGARSIVGNATGRFGRGRWMLAEACEYRDNFRHLHPQLAVILGIEPDHFDCFATPAELEAAFAQFAARVPDDGMLLARADCAATSRVLTSLRSAHESFGFSRSATWHATELRERQGFYTFQVRYGERMVCEVKLYVPGKHNVLNALAAAALASHCGASGAAIRAGLERFAGLRRRLQLLGEVRQVAVLDDYAHHPTEVAATLATIRQMYPQRRLWCVFQPHQASRTRYLLDEFAASLHNADKIIVSEIVRARESAAPTGEVTAADLAARVAERGGDARQLASAAEIHDHLRQSLRPGDVVVTMGAGDIGRIAHELGQGLRTYRQAG